MIFNKILILLLTLQITHCLYNKSESIIYAYLSAITNCKKAEIEAWNCKDCAYISDIKNITFIQNTITKISGFIGYLQSTGKIIISWRGTIDARNWAQDFNFQMMAYGCKGCQIHTGFYESYKSVQSRVRATIQTLMKQYPSAKLFVTGQSLGGALATVCGLELQLQYGKVQQIHNFGSPRVGNENYAKFVTSKIKNVYRVVHNRDLIPHLPPQQLALYHYRHVYYQVFFDQKMQNYQICDESGEDKNCSNKYFPQYWMPDHNFYFITMDC